MMKKLCLLSAIISMLASTASAQTISTSDLSRIDIGTEKSAVHSAIGEGETDLSGLKEQYTVERNGTAVLHYDENTFVRGFLIQ